MTRNGYQTSSPSYNVRSIMDCFFRVQRYSFFVQRPYNRAYVETNGYNLSIELFKFCKLNKISSLSFNELLSKVKRFKHGERERERENISCIHVRTDSTITTNMQRCIIHRV